MVLRFVLRGVRAASGREVREVRRHEDGGCRSPDNVEHLVPCSDPPWSAASACLRLRQAWLRGMDGAEGGSFGWGPGRAVGGF